MDDKFDKWNSTKKDINNKKFNLKFRSRDIYFMSVGQNIGSETYGKGDEFLRPVLVYKKLSKETFLGIPLTSKEKSGTYFFNFNLKGKRSTASFNQMRVFDIKRIKFYYGEIGCNTFSNLEKKLENFMKVTPHKEENGPKGLKSTSIIPNKEVFVNKTILVTGGAGYIGSHVVKQLLETTKFNIVILDNLSTGSIKTLSTLKNIRDFEFIELDLKNFDEVEKVFKTHNIETIIHFAASIVVPESVENPLKYYMNNTVNTTNLINCAVKNGVKKFIFSSTAAVYGEPKNIPKNGIDEKHETRPINPYGMSKIMSENVIRDTANANEGFKYVIFRYFNVAGADIFYENNILKPRIGQCFPNATHLIKIASECATQKREKMAIFGDDYPTKDGTCIRDYIHVDDLANAHIKAVEYLENNKSDTFNVGYGRGYSVKEVIQTMKNTTCKNFQVNSAIKRAGDPATLISNNGKIKSKMNWQPKYEDLALICKSAYGWELSVQ